VAHTFTGNTDGSEPTGLMVGPDGLLYGTTGVGGPGNGGTLYSLTPSTSGGPWTATVIHSFSGADGSGPWAPPVAGANGTFYGTTAYGGNGSASCPIGCGVVYSLKPPAVAGGAWTESVLYRFTGGSDGANPFGRLAIGKNGQLYGTANWGANCYGTVWQLSPSGGGSWNLTPLHRFKGPDGEIPYGGVLLNNNGTLYGTTYLGGAGGSSCPSGCGTIFRVVP
jgi:uncharacterized repeat protein (TIGR03803 family)